MLVIDKLKKNIVWLLLPVVIIPQLIIGILLFANAKENLKEQSLKFLKCIVDDSINYANLLDDRAKSRISELKIDVKSAKNLWLDKYKNTKIWNDRDKNDYAGFTVLNKEGEFLINSDLIDEDKSKIIEKITKNRKGYLEYEKTGEGEKRIIFYEYYALWDWVISVVNYKIYHNRIETAARKLCFVVFGFLVLIIFAVFKIAKKNKENTQVLEDTNLELIRYWAEIQDKASQLEQLNKRLKEKNEALTNTKAELETSNKKLLNLEKLKEELTQMIVHDLKGPLTNIKNSLDILNMGMAGKLSKEQKKYAKMGINASQRLINMIEELLDIYKMEEDKISIEKQKCDFKSMLITALKTYEFEIEKKNIDFKINIKNKIPILELDKDRIIRVFENLIGNAIKYSPNDSLIEAKAYYDNNKREVIFSLKDEGFGIPEEHQDKIFDKFYQVKDKDNHSRIGKGLGLTFCKLVIEAHNGSIWVESKSGKGSTFYFSIPL